MFSAKAIARMEEGAASTSAAAIAPVGKNKHTIASPKQLSTTGKQVEKSPNQTDGKQPSSANVITYVYACGDFFNHFSANFPPVYVPMAPHIMTSNPK